MQFINDSMLNVDFKNEILFAYTLNCFCGFVLNIDDKHHVIDVS